MENYEFICFECVRQIWLQSQIPRQFVVTDLLLVLFYYYEFVYNSIEMDDQTN